MNFKMISLNIGIKWWLIFALGVLVSHVIFAQPNHKIDSIKHLLTTAEADTNKVKILNDLSYLINQTSDYITAKSYSDDALTLAHQLKFRSGEARAY